MKNKTLKNLIVLGALAVFVFGAVVALHVAAAMLYQQLYSRIEEYGGGNSY